MSALTRRGRARVPPGTRGATAAIGPLLLAPFSQYTAASALAVTGRAAGARPRRARGSAKAPTALQRCAKVAALASDWGTWGQPRSCPTNAAGKYECERCDRTFTHRSGFTTHRRSCTGRDWACGWCHATQSKRKIKGPGGPATLCNKCGLRLRKGHTGPAPELPTNAAGLSLIHI